MKHRQIGVKELDCVVVAFEHGATILDIADLQSNLPAVDAKFIGAHSQDGENLVIGNKLGFYVSKLLGISKRLAFSDFANVLVDGYQYILKKMNIRVVAVFQSFTWILPGMLFYPQTEREDLIPSERKQVFE